MKFFTFLCVSLFWINAVTAQDTLKKIKINYNFHGYLIANETDTIESIFTREKVLFSTKVKHANRLKEEYTRYYPNGEIISVTLLDSNLQNGISSYYSDKGKKVAELFWENDSLIKTNFIAKKHSLLVGKMTFNSTMHGGVDYGDGRSNVTQGQGPFTYSEFFAVKLDSTKKEQEKYCIFNVDFNGNFSIVAEEGEFGIFTQYFSPANVKPNMGTQGRSISNSSTGGWNIIKPIELKNNDTKYIHLHHSSSSYAP